MTKDNSSGGDGDEPMDGFLSAYSALNKGMDELRPRLVNTAYQISEVQQSEDFLTSAVTNAYFALHGVLVGGNEAKLEFAEADLAEIDAILADLADKMRTTPRWLLSAPQTQNRGEDAPKAVPYKDWGLRHKIEYPILWVALPAMLGASYLSAKAALLASGLPSYIDNPVLTSAVALIPAFGAIMLKSLGSLFSGEQAKKRYAFLVYGLAAGMLGTWAVSFADAFSDLGGGPLDLFGEEPAWKSKLLVGAQLGFEFFAGTAIYLRIEQLSRVYAHDTWFANLEYLGFEETHTGHAVLREGQRDNVAERRGLKISHQSALDLQIDLALASLRAKRARGSEPTL